MRLKSGSTGFARIDAVIASVEHSQDWTQANSQGESYLYHISAAMNLDIFEPFTAEQSTLSAYLAGRLAGKRLCDYAWRLYAQSIA